jgi:putative glycosyl hydrolase-like family 15 (GHL15) protein/type IX secretion system substrate protein
MKVKTSFLPGLLLLAVTTAHGQTDTAPKFPRVASIYSKKNPSENLDSGKRAISRYNLYVSDMTWWGLNCGGNVNCNGHASSSVGQYFKILNPKQIDLMYQHSVYYGGWSAPADGRGFIIGTTPYYLDLRWFLCYAGSTLGASMTTTDTVVSVGDLSKFAVGDYALIGGVASQNDELVKIDYRSGSSGSGTLHVVRAQVSQNGKYPAVTHDSADYIRSVAYGLGQQSFMAFNMSSNCPASSINIGFGSQTYNEFIASFWGAKMTYDSLYANLDGIFLDNFLDVPKEIIHNPSNIDYTNVNTATPSPTNSLYWRTGMADLAHQMRNALPTGKIIVANTGDSVSLSGAYLNGGMIEGVDQNGHNGLVGDSTYPGDSPDDPANFYNGWIAGGYSPQTFIYNGSSSADTSLTMGQTDYKAMRFLLTLTMMNNGYFDYDEFLMHNPGGGLNGGGHQSAWWYDEFDNAGTGIGYLGNPLSASTQPVTGVYRRDFEKGVAITNTTTGTVTIQLGKYFKKINGTQDPTVNNGATVDSVTLAAKDGIILYDCANVQAPTNLTTTRLKGAIRIDWTASTTPGITSYSLYRGWLPGTETLYKTGITGTTYTDSVSPGIGYWYYAKAFISGCDSSVASNESLKYACPVVYAPSNLTVNRAPAGITLQWNASATAGVTYSVYRGWTNGTETFFKAGITDTTFFDSSVVAGVGYWYFVKAVIADCDSASSGEAFKYACQSVAAPTNLTETATTGKIVLTWNASTTPRVTYSVYRGWLPGSETYYAGSLTDTTFTDNNVTSGVGYWYYVTAVLSDCDSASSPEKLKYAVSHNNGAVSGAGASLTLDSVPDISIYPNPSHGEVDIVLDLPQSTDVNITIWNAQGQMAGELTDGNLSAGVHHFTFHGGALPKGVYFCKLRKGNTLSTYKIMIL